MKDGTGPGLSPGKRRVEIMGGTIFFTSRPGQGVAFAFDLPAGREERP
jgi:signal transduction histidine kinase